MIEPSVLRAMLAAGATAEMIVAAVEADYEAEEEKKAVKRAKDAERQRKKRRADDVSRDVHTECVTRKTRTRPASQAVQGQDGLDNSGVSHGGDADGAAKEGPPHPLKKTNTPLNEAKASLPPEPASLGTNACTSTSNVSKKRASRGRGTRLPQDWHPDESLWTWGQDKLGLEVEMLRFETGAFRDHFWGAPGQKGVKLDWNRTWKNWMREAVRRSGRARGGSPAGSGDDWRKAVREVEGADCDNAGAGDG